MQKAKTESKNESKRAKTRGKVRGKRSKLRGKAAAACALLAVVVIGGGCASATPSSKSQRSDSRNNTATVIINVYAPTGGVVLANAEAMPPVHVSVSDLIGTMVQSADAGGDEAITQSATPTNTSGVTGDKPIDMIGDVGKAALTGGTSSAFDAAATAASGSQ